MAEAVARSERGERTRQRILDVALDLFRTQGYESTTMRAIAEAAGVAVGNTYYYFPSKDHLVQAFYERMHVERVTRSREELHATHDLRGRLRGAMRARLEVLRPYHAVSGTLFRTAADPRNPLSPFSAQSGPTRRACVEFWREVIAGSDARLPRDVRTSLPHLLWLYELGIVLFWLHDASPDQRRTQDFVDDTIDAIVRLLPLAGLPGVRSVRTRMLRWVSTLAEVTERRG
ncbi:MAG TPA: TetR family transcriptional regulator [Candidatus Dormibacteraeota bacterium]|nr:TetR family transcriptional regulator [Candidatus Dormibacteraeota bacterium]